MLQSRGLPVCEPNFNPHSYWKEWTGKLTDKPRFVVPGYGILTLLVGVRLAKRKEQEITGMSFQALYWWDTAVLVFLRE